MITFDCVGMFCEDIREEVGGSHTIIGVMPDNIALSAANLDQKRDDQSLMMSKVAIYIRVNFDTFQPRPGIVSARVLFPGLPEIPMGELSSASIEAAFEDSRAKNNPKVGVIFKGLIAPLHLKSAGTAISYVTVNEQDRVCGALNIQFGP